MTGTNELRGTTLVIAAALGRGNLLKRTVTGPTGGVRPRSETSVRPSFTAGFFQPRFLTETGTLSLGVGYGVLRFVFALGGLLLMLEIIFIR
jgi:hypothetical protein